jgi:cellulose biosynthesis protein BcsQ
VPEACTIAVAHQKGGVGKTTTTLLLAHELADLRPDWRVLVEDLDPYRHLTQRWPGDTLTLALVDDGTEEGDIRLLDTGPGDSPTFLHALNRADYVIVPVRPEPLSAQALGAFLPVLQQVQRRRGGPPALAGLVLTHVGPGRGRRLVQRQVEVFAAELGTEVLACIPISDRIGVYLSTQGHHYRPAAERVARLVEARQKASNAVSV